MVYYVPGNDINSTRVITLHILISQLSEDKITPCRYRISCNTPYDVIGITKIERSQYCTKRGAQRFAHNTIRTPDVSYTNYKNCNVSYTSFDKYRIQVYR